MDNTKLDLHEDLIPEFQRELPLGIEQVVAINPFIGIDTPYSDFWLNVIYENEVYGGNLSKFGKEVAKHVTGKTFLDLGCGIPYQVSAAAEKLGAKKYIGIDKNVPLKPFKITERAMPAYAVKGDILSFLARRSASDGTVFFSYGIDAHSNKDFERYLSAVYDEMKRLGKKGDIAFSESNVINPEKAGFKRNEKGFYVFS
ncbi:MAG: hypothetical protein ABSG05_00850 [Candidatus Pacearchaeota archaeon]|jgi:hypothetical protein